MYPILLLVSSQLMGQASLICDTSRITPNSVIRLGIYLKPANGWHSYWSNPGDSGGPTSIKLTGPQGWKIGAPIFPTPSRIESSGEISYGYAKPFLVQIPVSVPANPIGTKFHFTGRVKWLTCTSEICKPADHDVDLELTNGAKLPSLWTTLFSTDAHQFPSVVSTVKAAAKIGKTEIKLQISGLPKTSEAKYYFFVDRPGTIDHSKTQAFSWEGSILVGTLPVSPYAQKTPERISGVLTDSRKSFFITAPVTSQVKT